MSWDTRASELSSLFAPAALSAKFNTVGAGRRRAATTLHSVSFSTRVYNFISPTISVAIIINATQTYGHQGADNFVFGEGVGTYEYIINKTLYNFNNLII